MHLELLENAHANMQFNVYTVCDSLEDVQMITHARLDAMNAHVTAVVKTIVQLPTSAKGNDEEGSLVWGDSVNSLRTIYEKKAQEGSVVKHASQTKIVALQVKTS